jgi:amidase
VSSPATWILRLDEGRAGSRFAVKDLIDVAGAPTTAGCRPVAERAGPAAADAACLAGIRAAVDAGRARLVGKANLHELADGVTGINRWAGTPVNPLDAAAVPGGSSSGSAAAVAAGEADLALGTDTAGSIRIPAACCGITGLRPTHGRVSGAGVWPLAPSLDTVGPLAADVSGVVEGMELLVPGFAGEVPASVATLSLARLRLGGAGLLADPDIDTALDRLLAAAELPVTDVHPTGWGQAVRDGLTILGTEADGLHGAFVRRHRASIGDDVVAGFAHAATVGHQRLLRARAGRARWGAEVTGWWREAAAVVLPTLGVTAPPVGPAAARVIGVSWTLPPALAGLPALALPLPLPGRRLPASVQLVGPPGGDGLLCALGRRLEAALAGS